jgi:hypothetical protein
MSAPCADQQISRARATTWWCYTCWCNMQHGKDPGGLSGQVGGWVGGRDPPELMRHIGITVWQGNPTQCARHQNRLPIGWTCVNSLQKRLHHCVQRSGLTNEPASSRGGKLALAAAPSTTDGLKVRTLRRPTQQTQQEDIRQKLHHVSCTSTTYCTSGSSTHPAGRA